MHGNQLFLMLKITENPLITGTLSALVTMCYALVLILAKYVPFTNTTGLCDATHPYDASGWAVFVKGW